ncbi:MAG: hypothetical protein K2F86_00935 [Duncaniella sp.]|nr:hypothetical protein [Duncaniella sp.]
MATTDTGGGTERRDRFSVWLTATVAIMFLLPLATAAFAPENAGMALCMMLFYVVNPIYSAILGYRCGKDIRRMRYLPPVSATTFLAGSWLFFDMAEPCFAAYAAVYLAISEAMMWLSHMLRKTLKQKQPNDTQKHT